MKILWFTNNTVNLNKELTRGGWMQSLAQHLAVDENIQLYIATRYNGKKISRITEQKTIYFLVPDQRNLLQKRIDIFLNRELIDDLVQQYLTIIDEIKPDIIHVFGTEMEYGLVGGLTDIPVVIHIQGILQPLYYHLGKIHLSFLKKISSQGIIDFIKGSTIQNGLRIFKRRVGIEKKIYVLNKYFMGRTEWDKQITHLFAPHAYYFHCDEMLRKAFLDTHWTGNTSETTTIVSIISSPLYKGHETLVATCLVLKENGINNFIWHVIGLDATMPPYRFFYKPYMQQPRMSGNVALVPDNPTGEIKLTRPAGIGDNIKLHGELKPDEIISILQNADVYVHPSHIENSSNSICEAMALGMPVIALHTGGNGSLITHGVDGLLVADNDPYALAATIQQVVSNQDQSRKMGNNAKVRAAVRHNPDKIISDLKSIYQNILDIHAHQ